MAWQKFWNEVFRFLLYNVILEPLSHDMIVLLPVLNNLLQILLTLRKSSQKIY